MNEAHYALMIKRLEAFRRLLSLDLNTPVRISMTYLTVDKRRFVLTITGVKSPVISGNGFSYGDTFIVKFDVPEGFPAAIPVIKFEQHIPFHPHVFRSGSICWGTYNNGSLTNPSLIVWVVNLLYYLEYNQHPAYQMNTLSPANTIASEYYVKNRQEVIRRIPQMRMDRVIRWAASAEETR